MTLQEIYVRLYNFSVTVYQDCLLVGFTSDKVDFVIKEIHNEKLLKQPKIEDLFSQLTEVGEHCECTELRILAHGGWKIDSDTLSNNPYQYQGKSLYNTEYYNSLLTGRHIELFAHNEYACTKVADGFKNSKIGAVVQATGTGKSYIISRRISELPLIDKILIIAPSVVIFNEIKKALRFDYGNVDYITFQGLAAYETARRNNLKYDHIIIDEFHHSESEIWGNAIAEVIAVNADAYILGTSATPLRPSDNINVVESVFEGNLFHEFNLSDAISFGVLPQPKVVQSVYNLNEVVSRYTEKLSQNAHTLTKERREEIEVRLRNMKTAFEPIQVSKIIQKHVPGTTSHFFVFCSNIEELRKMKKEVVAWFSAAGFSDIQSFIVHSELSDKKNLVTLEQFQKDRDGLSLLFSVDMLSEGLHVRNVDGAMFLRKTSSYIVCLQQLGRTLKAGVGAQPIILDFVNNISNAISYETIFERGANPPDQIISSDYKRKDIFKLIVNDAIIENLSDYIKGIESLWNSYDIKWETNFSALSQYLIDNEGQYPTRKTQLGKWVGTQRQQKKNSILSQDRIERLDSIGFDWGVSQDEITNIWDAQFSDLAQYISDNGGEYPTFKTKLGQWVHRQRTALNKGNLFQERIDMLNSIGFDWNIFDIKWNTRFEELSQYLIDNEGEYPYFKTQLGNWAQTQRQYKNKGYLSQDRIDRLDSIGFDWGVSQNEITNIWNTRLSELALYISDNDGEYPITKTQLGQWVQTQRTNKKEGVLSQERIDMLNSIGLDWGSQNENWDTRFEDLAQYISDNGGEYPTFKTKLGQWVSTQRQQKKNSILSQDRIDRLNSIGFDWGIFNSNIWDTRFSDLAQYLSDNGGEYPYCKTQLGKWVHRQRSAFNKGTLSQDRIKKLDSNGFEWNIFDIKWNTRFEELSQYFIDNEGEYPTFKTQLGVWVNDQRKAKKNGKLSQDRIDRLDSIGFKWSGRE